MIPFPVYKHNKADVLFSTPALRFKFFKSEGDRGIRGQRDKVRKKLDRRPGCVIIILFFTGGSGDAGPVHAGPEHGQYDS